MEGLQQCGQAVCLGYLISIKRRHSRQLLCAQQGSKMGPTAVALRLFSWRIVIDPLFTVDSAIVFSVKALCTCVRFARRLSREVPQRDRDWEGRWLRCACQRYRSGGSKIHRSVSFGDTAVGRDQGSRASCCETRGLFGFTTLFCGNKCERTYCFTYSTLPSHG